MAKNTLLEYPFEFIKVDKLGILFYPVVSIELLTIYGFKKFDFLVDTGADVTTIPSSVASLLHVNLNKLPKSITVGIGGVEVAVKETFLPIRIDKFNLKIRVNITEGGSAFLLGKKDVFENMFSLRLDSVKKLTILEKN
ncbi:retroviral-like aspartic protease family protein [Candidatus Gottesmanbacteria bacterium]|nr:retroviral-like aspartic protease family protein [Candidatus Gottesmanbacteria bacterium]